MSIQPTKPLYISVNSLDNSPATSRVNSRAASPRAISGDELKKVEENIEKIIDDFLKQKKSASNLEILAADVSEVLRGSSLLIQPKEATSVDDLIKKVEGNRDALIKAQKAQVIIIPENETRQSLIRSARVKAFRVFMKSTVLLPLTALNSLVYLFMKDLSANFTRYDKSIKNNLTVCKAKLAAISENEERIRQLVKEIVLSQASMADLKKLLDKRSRCIIDLNGAIASFKEFKEIQRKFEKAKRFTWVGKWSFRGIHSNYLQARFATQALKQPTSSDLKMDRSKGYPVSKKIEQVKKSLIGLNSTGNTKTLTDHKKILETALTDIDVIVTRLNTSQDEEVTKLIEGLNLEQTLEDLRKIEKELVTLPISIEMKDYNITLRALKKALEKINQTQFPSEKIKENIEKLKGVKIKLEESNLDQKALEVIRQIDLIEQNLQNLIINKRSITSAQYIEDLKKAKKELEALNESQLPLLKDKQYESYIEHIEKYLEKLSVILESKSDTLPLDSEQEPNLEYTRFVNIVEKLFEHLKSLDDVKKDIEILKTPTVKNDAIQALESLRNLLLPLKESEEYVQASKIPNEIKDLELYLIDCEKSLETLKGFNEGLSTIRQAPEQLELARGRITITQPK